jgi:hypothetical protein
MEEQMNFVGFEDDSWWQDALVLGKNDVADDGSTVVVVAFRSDVLIQFYNECSCAFFDEKMSKRDYFQVCCLRWIHSYLLCDCQQKPSPLVRLWTSLKQAYLDGRNQDTMSIVRWILPVPDFMTVLSNDANKDDIAMTQLMMFWKELYQAFDDSSPDSTGQDQRPAKRRRLASNRDKSGFTSLLKGGYKLPAVYLLISVLKDRASNWKTLHNLAHQLPTSFKTFSENDVQAGLALVGWNMILCGKTIEGLSIQGLFGSYLSQSE